MNENITIGVIIYESDTNGFINNNYTFYKIKNILINDYYQNDNEFSPFRINQEYNILYDIIQDNTTSFKSKNLKKLYIRKPIFTLKRKYLIKVMNGTL